MFYLLEHYRMIMHYTLVLALTWLVTLAAVMFYARARHGHVAEPGYFARWLGIAMAIGVVNVCFAGFACVVISYRFTQPEGM